MPAPEPVYLIQLSAPAANSAQYAACPPTAHGPDRKIVARPELALLYSDKGEADKDARAWLLCSAGRYEPAVREYLLEVKGKKKRLLRPPELPLFLKAPAPGPPRPLQEVLGSPIPPEKIPGAYPLRQYLDDRCDSCDWPNFWGVVFGVGKPAICFSCLHKALRHEDAAHAELTFAHRPGVDDHDYFDQPSKTWHLWTQRSHRPTPEHVLYSLPEAVAFLRHGRGYPSAHAAHLYLAELQEKVAEYYPGPSNEDHYDLDRHVFQFYLPPGNSKHLGFETVAFPDVFPWLHRHKPLLRPDACYPYLQGLLDAALPPTKASLRLARGLALGKLEALQDSHPGNNNPPALPAAAPSPAPAPAADAYENGRYVLQRLHEGPGHHTPATFRVAGNAARWLTKNRGFTPAQATLHLHRLKTAQTAPRANFTPTHKTRTPTAAPAKPKKRPRKTSTRRNPKK